MPILSQSEHDTLTHIVSIVCLAITVISLNAIEFYYDTKILDVNLFWIVIQNCVFGAGMAYYAVKFAITPSGVNLETKPT